MEPHTRCPRAATRAGAALSIFDVLSSAFGVLAPLYNGFFLGRLGVAVQPLVACVHYAVILAVARFALAEPAAAKQKRE